MRKMDTVMERLEAKIDGLSSHMNRRFDVLSRRTLNLESSIRDIRSIIDKTVTEENDNAVPVSHTLPISTSEYTAEPVSTEPAPPTTDLYDGIPPAYHIPLETLRFYESSKSSRGNFAAKLVEVLFPELFGPDNLSRNYSYNGGKRYNKIELDPVRKMAIKRYITFFYPDLKRPDSYQKAIIDHINERLRRKDTETRREYEERRRAKSSANFPPKALESPQYTNVSPSPVFPPPSPTDDFDDLPSDLHISQIEGDLFGDLSAARNAVDNASFAEL